jgi:hypothetical protein
MLSKTSYLGGLPMRRNVLMLAFASALLVAMAVLLFGSSGSALADHDHNLITPGKTVVDVADGQTEKCATDPGGHQFHENVHIGVPGTFAFAEPNNPVSIIKTENATC